ncbi:MAG: hypothetical protein R3C44_06230 [Chloroflexota bacterium]
MSTNSSGTGSPFTAILQGKEPGTIIAQDDDQRFAIITSLEPEAAVHWLALPYEAGQSTEEFQANDQERFLRLVDWTISQVQSLAPEYSDLTNGFTIKMHFGAYETIPHAKLHVLSVE